MLLNPILAGMSQEDLNQRYRGTYIKYDSKAVWCEGLQFDGRLYIGITNRKGGKAEFIPFDWRKLDTSRPKSGWYESSVYRDEDARSVPFYFSLHIARQWSRGINRRNCSFYYPWGEPRDQWGVFLHVVENGDRGLFRNRLKGKQLDSHIREHNYIVMSPQISIIRTNRIPEIYFRRSRVGRFFGDEVCLMYPEFEQEVREVIDDVAIRVSVDPAIGERY